MDEVKFARVLCVGCERSGSTWLSNIFEAHPKVEFLMEPFYPDLGFFPVLPDRHFPVTAPSNELVAATQRGIEQAQRCKTGLFYRRGRASWLLGFDHCLVRALEASLRKLHLAPNTTLRRWHTLNLNTAENSGRSVNEKAKTYSHLVVKDLRINLHIPLLASAFPDLLYIVSIRHPAAQISSVMSLMERGHLGELRFSLERFLLYVGTLPEFLRYRPLLKQIRFEKRCQDTLIIWWIVNYDLVLRTLRNLRAQYFLAVNEKIAESPEYEIARLFSFCDLPISEPVFQYLRQSTRAVHDKRGLRPPLDTNRDSAVYARLAIDNADADLSRTVRRYVGETPLDDLLLSYLNSSGLA